MTPPERCHFYTKFFQNASFERSLLKMVSSGLSVDFHSIMGAKIDEDFHQFLFSLLETNDLPLITPSGILTLDFVNDPTLKGEMESKFPTPLLERLRKLHFGVQAVSKELTNERSKMDLIEMEKIVNETTFCLKECSLEITGMQEFKETMSVNLDFLNRELAIRKKTVLDWIEIKGKTARPPLVYDVKPLSVAKPMPMLSWGKREPLSIHFDRDLTGYLLRNHPDFLQTMYMEKFSPHPIYANKEVYQLLLDKVSLNAEFRKPYEAGSTMSHAMNLIDALEEYLSNLNNEIEKNKLTPIFHELIKGLSLLLVTPSMTSSSGRAAALYDRFQKGESPVLLGAGFQGHAMCLAIYRDGDEVLLKLYNTGGGIGSYHPMEERRYQTYVGIKIPKAELTPMLLQSFIDFASEAKSAAPIYEKFNELAKKGKKLPPSKNLFDYEPPQLSGSCTAQCLMAFMRDFIRINIPGDDIEKMGFYKLIKAEVLTIITKKRLPLLDSAIQGVANERLEEMGYEIGLINLAYSEPRWRQLYGSLCQELEKKGISNTYVIDTDDKIELPVMARSYLLHKALRSLAREWPLSLSTTLPNELHEFQPLFALWIKKDIARKQEFFAHLDKQKQQGDFKQLLESFFMDMSWAKSSVEEWVKQDMKKDPNFWNSLKKDEQGKRVYDIAKQIYPDFT